MDSSMIPSAPDFSDGLCRELDPEIFQPERGSSAEPAKRVCNGDKKRAPCPVLALCGEYALNHPTIAGAGVWGGMSLSERRKVVRAHPLL